MWGHQKNLDKKGGGGVYVVFMCFTLDFLSFMYILFKKVETSSKFNFIDVKFLKKMSAARKCVGVPPTPPPPSRPGATFLFFLHKGCANDKGTSSDW